MTSVQKSKILVSVFSSKMATKASFETLGTQCKFLKSFTLSKWFKNLSLKYCMWCILCICNSKKVAFFTLIFLFKKAKSCFLVVFLLTKFCKFTHCGTIDGYLIFFLTLKMT